jgi:hypothetical protein
MRATVKGQDMDREIFVKAIVLAEQYGASVTIGGGEPTLHPLLFDFLGIALASDFECKPHVITNGKLKAPALKLARMARANVIGAELSIDQYHERIDPRVQTAFTRDDRHSLQHDYNDLRGIRTVERISHMGRAADNEISTDKNCACDALFAAPNGTLWACAHKLEQFGDVFDPDIPQEYFNSDYQCSLRRIGEVQEEEEELELVA